MTNEIFTKAEIIRSGIEMLGLAVGPLCTSTNRNGDHSAYFDCAGGDRVRVSDHDTVCEDSFKWWAGTSADDIRAFVRNRCRMMAISAELAIINREAAARKATERRASYQANVDAAAANDAMLVAAGYDLSKLTKNTRKTALKALRKAN